MLDVTKHCLACTQCPEDFGNGDGLLRFTPDVTWKHAWIPPRGWAGSAVLAHRPIMLVALNPGHPIPEELKTYAHAGVHPYRSATEVADAHAQTILEFVTDKYTNWRRSQDSVYGRKCLAYVYCAAWLVRRICSDSYHFDPACGDWREFAWITDAFKCSTRRDSGPRIPENLISQCVRLHLIREIQVLTPRVILALGGASHLALRKAGIGSGPGGGPSLILLRHASQGCPPIYNAKHDASLQQIANALDTSQPSNVVQEPDFSAFRVDIQNRLFPRRGCQP